VLASGLAVGQATATGVARFIASAGDLDAFQPGDILMAEFTAPGWEQAMEKAAAIVTNRGGPDSHAAITARRLGVPAVIGAVDGASRLWTGAMLTVSCAEGDVGRVYEVASVSAASLD
jgi:pyruvate,water dikinase